jgi:hypothetical protein
VSEEELLAQRLKMIEACLALGMTGWCLWSMIPAHRRQLWRMRVLAVLHGWTGNAARRAGAGSMRAELTSGGMQNYVLPYGLSLARERLGMLYDRTRGVTP